MNVAQLHSCKVTKLQGYRRAEVVDGHLKAFNHVTMQPCSSVTLHSYCDSPRKNRSAVAQVAALSVSSEQPLIPAALSAISFT